MAFLRGMRSRSPRQEIPRLSLSSFREGSSSWLFIDVLSYPLDFASDRIRYFRSLIDALRVIIRPRPLSRYLWNVMESLHSRLKIIRKVTYKFTAFKKKIVSFKGKKSDSLFVGENVCSYERFLFGSTLQ